MLRISISDITQIRMQDPLKQGLKRISIRSLTCGIFIRMQDPLKQGLKHHPSGAASDVPFDQFECKIH